MEISIDYFLFKNNLVQVEMVTLDEPKYSQKYSRVAVISKNISYDDELGTMLMGMIVIK